MNPEEQTSWRDVHPDFDGHRKPVSEMSDAERLQLAWEGTLLLHWARRAKLEPPLKPPKPDEPSEAR